MKGEKLLLLLRHPKFWFLICALLGTINFMTDGKGAGGVTTTTGCTAG